MEEILQVQSEINSIQEVIESGTGRVNYLTHQSAYSTINLKYFQYLKGTTTADELPSFFTQLKEAFKDGSEIISGLLLILATFWPVCIIAAFVWIYIRKIKPVSSS